MTREQDSVTGNVTSSLPSLMTVREQDNCQSPIVLE